MGSKESRYFGFLCAPRLTRFVAVVAFSCTAGCAVGPNGHSGGSDASQNGDSDAPTNGDADTTDGCPANHSKVAGQCVDLATDNDNCGTAGNVCSATTACLGGTCTVPKPMPTARSPYAATLGPDGKIYVIGGGVKAAGSTTDVVEAYDPRTNEWTTARSTPNRFIGRAITTKEGTIHAIGQDGHYAYDVRSNAWSKRAREGFLQFRAGVTLANDGRIFVLGGYTVVANKPQQTAEANAYDPATDTWTPLPAMPSAKAAMGATTGSNGLIYTFGATVDAFNPATMKWSTIKKPASIGYIMYAAPASQTIYALGAGLGGFYLYDPAKNAWTSEPDLSAAHAGDYRLGATMVVGADGRVFVIGGGLIGGINSKVTNAVEVFDPKRRTWIASPP